MEHVVGPVTPRTLRTELDYQTQGHASATLEPGKGRVTLQRVLASLSTSRREATINSSSRSAAASSAP